MLTLYIIIYLVIGLILRLIGPIARDLNRNVMNFSWKKYFRVGWVSIGSPKPKLLDILRMEIVISLLFIIFWPIGIILFIPHYITEKKEEKSIIDEYSKDEKYFYFDGLKSGKAKGEGYFSCLDCEYEEYITVSTHGVSPNGDFLGFDGFQCQECGKFHRLVNYEDGKNYFGECGGILSNEEIVFCPNCKSKNVDYKARFIT